MKEVVRIELPFKVEVVVINNLTISHDIFFVVLKLQISDLNDARCEACVNTPSLS